MCLIIGTCSWVGSITFQLAWLSPLPSILCHPFLCTMLGWISVLWDVIGCRYGGRSCATWIHSASKYSLTWKMKNVVGKKNGGGGGGLYGTQIQPLIMKYLFLILLFSVWSDSLYLKLDVILLVCASKFWLTIRTIKENIFSFLFHKSKSM